MEASSRRVCQYLVCRVQAKEAYKKIVLEPPARIVELRLCMNGKETLHCEVGFQFVLANCEGLREQSGRTAVPLDLRGGFVAGKVSNGVASSFSNGWVPCSRQATSDAPLKGTNQTRHVCSAVHHQSSTGNSGGFQVPLHGTFSLGIPPNERSRCFGEM